MNSGVLEEKSSFTCALFTWFFFFAEEFTIGVYSSAVVTGFMKLSLEIPNRCWPITALKSDVDPVAPVYHIPEHKKVFKNRANKAR